MNYKVLYRKYRPDSFDSLIGQEHIVSVLKNSIKEGKIAHSYLFSGPRGTGKTSTARILARAINCLDNQSGAACGKCLNCQNFLNNPDIIEIDAASNNGVDEIRELINNVKIMPTSLKYKVYIIDEVHMLSQSAFNALLLTLEEPPAHVIFIMATTNLESVPITILSRCQKFDFKRISKNDIVNRLKYICDEEKIPYEMDGLQEIATLSDGGLRDALSVLDQLSKLDEKITSTLVSKEIGSIADSEIERLVKALDNNDIKIINEIFENIQNINLNYKVFIKKTINYLTNIGAEILVDSSKWKLGFDDIKRLVMELNDVIAKISINVDPYVLIKMIFLSYIKIDTKEFSKENKCKEEQNVKEIKQVSEDKEVIESKVNSDLIDIKINNCFVKASKSFLIDIKPKWEEFIKNVKDSLVKGLISDTMVATASDKYIIITTSIPHKDEEINENCKIIEEYFKNFVNKEYNLIFIDDSKWKLEKEKYINNLKNKYVYTYIDENVESKDNISIISDVFDIEKVEIE